MTNGDVAINGKGQKRQIFRIEKIAFLNRERDLFQRHRSRATLQISPTSAQLRLPEEPAERRLSLHDSSLSPPSSEAIVEADSAKPARRSNITDNSNLVSSLFSFLPGVLDPPFLSPNIRCVSVEACDSYDSYYGTPPSHLWYGEAGLAYSTKSDPPAYSWSWMILIMLPLCFAVCEKDES